MNIWEVDEDRMQGPGPGGFLLLMSLALGAAAALLLATKPGHQVREQIAGRADGWKSQAADAIAQGREKLIAAVEEQTPSEDGRHAPVREKPL